MLARFYTSMMANNTPSEWRFLFNLTPQQLDALLYGLLHSLTIASYTSTHDRIIYYFIILLHIHTSYNTAEGWSDNSTQQNQANSGPHPTHSKHIIIINTSEIPVYLCRSCI